MNDRPWMTALEMQFATLAMLHSEPPPGHPMSDQLSSFWRALAWGLKRAECYAWSTDTAIAVAIASQTIPSDVAISLDILPSPSGWWWFSAPVHVPNLTTYTSRMCAIAWWQEVEGIAVCAFTQDAVGFSPMPVFDIRIGYGQSLADAASYAVTKSVRPTTCGDVARSIGGIFVGGCAWLKQRVVTSSSGHIERHRRKQLARVHDAIVPSDVKVIQLRRSESPPAPSKLRSEPAEWAYRWIVNGHWRNQPYANGDRKLIYIMPFVKGPEGKPLRVPTHTVYQVDR